MRLLARLRIAVPALAAALLAGCGGGDAPPPQAPDDPRCLALPDAVTWSSPAEATTWNAALVDAEGRLWLAGRAGGNGSPHEPGGDTRAVLKALGRDGRLAWDAGAAFDSTGTDSFEALSLRADGGLYAAGRSTGMLGGPNAGQSDTFVAWRDGGELGAAWRLFQTGTERPQIPRRIGVGTDGTVHVVGYDGVHAPDRAVLAWPDPFALRLDRAGTSIQTAWLHQFSTEEDDIATGLAVLGDATYIAGSARGMFLRRIDAAGGAAWTRHYTTHPLDDIAALLALPDGTLLIAGTVAGRFGDAPSIGGTDVFVARVAAEDGRVLASWQFGSSAGDGLVDMALDADGGIVLLGETLGAVAPGARPRGQTDLFMLRLSPRGELLAAKQWGTAGDDVARGLAIDICGQALAVGSAPTPQGSSAGIVWAWRR
jgi:hypothetical protein